MSENRQILTFELKNVIIDYVKEKLSKLKSVDEYISYMNSPQIEVEDEKEI